MLGLSTSALRGLAAIGIMEQAGLSGSPLRRLQDQTQVKGPHTAASHAAPPSSDIPITIGLLPRSSAGCGRWRRGRASHGETHTDRPARPARRLAGSDLLERLRRIAIPRHQRLPGTRRLGRAAGPRCRRGAGRAMGRLRSQRPWCKVTPPRSRARRPRRRRPPFRSCLTPRARPAAAVAGGAGGPAITRNAAASHLGQGGSAGGAAGGGGLRFHGRRPGAGTTSPVTIKENPSSLPSSTAGNGSGFSQLSFPYYPMYVLDENDGIVLFNSQYQLASLGGYTDLYAQVKGTTVSSYSWTTSGGYTQSTSGASTYHFDLHWDLMNSSGASETESITLTVTDTNSHQESQTFYFVLPQSAIVTMPSSASWPVTIPPDLVEPGSPMIASQGVSVDADSGALDTEIDLPSYNPNVPGPLIDL